MPLLDGHDARAIDRAADLLAAGELLAFPTETVYGLGARADSDEAVGRIFAAKGRPREHPLIVHLASADAVPGFAASVSAPARALAACHWPGPLTLILPRRPDRGAAAAGGQGSIGLRVPAHPVALALLRACALRGVPGVAGPSANRFGRVSPTTAAHVVDEFGPALAVLDGGPCRVGIESAIVDCTGERPTLLRPGALSRAELEAAAGVAFGDRHAQSPRASGTLEAHYAPSARVHLFDTAALRLALAADRLPPGLAVYSRLPFAAVPGVACRAMPDDPAAAAHELFAVLRAFDAGGARTVWVEAPPPGPEWDGVRDRLTRAAAAAA